MRDDIMTFDEAGAYLDDLYDALPEGITRELNGGVNLLPEEKPSETDGLSILGMYFSGGQMGRYIELYYGSFVKLFGDKTREAFARELKKTLYHELTHHIESLAGDRSLEREDARFLADFEAMRDDETLEVNSVLFVSFGDASRAAMADGMFRALCAEAGEDIRSGAAVYRAEGEMRPDAAAVKAAARYGADISSRITERLTREVLEKYDAAVCMTEDEGDELAEEFPFYDERIYSIGEKDAPAPSGPLGYVKCARLISEGVRMLLDDLTAEYEDD